MSNKDPNNYYPIVTPAGFLVEGQWPIDARTIVDTRTDLDNISLAIRYYGLQVYILDEMTAVVWEEDDTSPDGGRWAPFSGGETLFTDERPTPIDLGGIPAGSTFYEVPLTTMWRDFLYPFIDASIIEFKCVEAINTIYEPGWAWQVTETLHFEWTAERVSSLDDSHPFTIKCPDYNSNIIHEDIFHDTDGGADDTHAYTYPARLDYVVGLDEAGDITWEVSAIDKEGKTVKDTTDMLWRWKVYWFKSPDEAIPPDIATRNGKPLESHQNTYDYPSTDGDPQYLHLLYPSDFDPAVKFWFNGYEVPMDLKGNQIPIENIYDKTTTYYHYVSVNKTAGKVNLTVI